MQMGVRSVCGVGNSKRNSHFEQQWCIFTIIVQNHGPGDSAEGTRKSPTAGKIDVRKQFKYVTDTLSQYLNTAGKINHVNALRNKV